MQFQYKRIEQAQNQLANPSQAHIENIYLHGKTTPHKDIAKPKSYVTPAKGVSIVSLISLTSYQIILLTLILSLGHQRLRRAWNCAQTVHV